MAGVTVTTRDGQVRTLDAEANRTLMEVIREHGISELSAVCGGCCSCATCHVYIDDPHFAERLPPINEDEESLLDGTLHRKEASRLSCQIRISDSLDGLRVTIAPED